ncbi:transcription factor bHLH35-like isoform X1 [Asparagus officinalis]|uniref:transcription factor bHLH35-like isoform X1 n=1 Tax=Asparagus officinalis TaxID=4686 RepID=UPI00098E5692|nr:transcription factor bHLH35-like isoform X1 [Asparagus officinalis]
MNNMEEDSFYLDIERFFEYEEPDSLQVFGDAIPSNESSSPEQNASSSSALPRSLVKERERRQLVNDKLKALRLALPNFTKFDKSSVVKDAIDYILMLQEQEKRMTAEILQLEAQVLNEKNNREGITKSSVLATRSLHENFSIQIMEIKMWQVGERTLGVNLICDKKRGNMIKVYELFESLNVNVIMANVTSVSESLLNTFFIEANTMNSTQLKEMMEGAIAELNSEGSLFKYEF